MASARNGAQPQACGETDFEGVERNLG